MVQGSQNLRVSLGDPGRMCLLGRPSSPYHLFTPCWSFLTGPHEQWTAAGQWCWSARMGSRDRPSASQRAGISCSFCLAWRMGCSLMGSWTPHYGPSGGR